MNHSNYVFGPLPSRRLGRSLGVSPIPEKNCNYTCVYCQLGRTTHMRKERKLFYPVDEILNELKERLRENQAFDVITVVGEGEPTLYLELGKLLKEIKKLTDKPLALITNGSMLWDSQIRLEISAADIVLPSLDAFDVASWKKINRPHGALVFDEIIKGIQLFSKEYKGQIWLEIMLVKGMNSSPKAIRAIKKLLKKIRYDRLYLNTPVRPPAESYAEMPDPDEFKKAIKVLKGIAIDQLTTGLFDSALTNPFEALLTIIRRHPMNQFEVEAFLDSRKEVNKKDIFDQLNSTPNIEVIDYKGIKSFRYK